MRYYFHVRRHCSLQEDPIGIELSGIEAVREEACESIREILADRIKSRNPVHADTIFEIRDADGELVLMLPFAAVLLSFLAPGVPQMPGVEEKDATSVYQFSRRRV